MEVKSGEVLEFPVGSDGVLWFGSRLCVPDVGGLRKNLLKEAHILPTQFMLEQSNCIKT